MDKSGQSKHPISGYLLWDDLSRAYRDFKIEEDFHPFNLTAQAQWILEQYSSKFGIPINNFEELTFRICSALIWQFGYPKTLDEGIVNLGNGAKREEYTYAEKYFWCAIRQIKGYFSEYLPTVNGKFCDDYSKIDTIPAVTLTRSMVSIAGEDPFLRLYYPEDLLADKEVKSLENIHEHEYAWLLRGVEINNDLWLHRLRNDMDPEPSQELWTKSVLSNDIAITSDDGVRRTRLKSKCYLIKSKDFPRFKELLTGNNHKWWDNYFRIETKLLNTGNLDPSNLYWMSWLEEENPVITFKAKDYGTFSAFPLFCQADMISKVSSSDVLWVPSRKLRSLLKIDSGDSYQGFIGNHCCTTYLSDNEWGRSASQELLLVEKDIFLQSAENSGFTVFWINWQLLQVSGDSPSKLSEGTGRHVRTTLVWLEAGEAKSAILEGDIDFPIINGVTFAYHGSKLVSLEVQDPRFHRHSLSYLIQLIGAGSFWKRLEENSFKLTSALIDSIFKEETFYVDKLGNLRTTRSGFIPLRNRHQEPLDWQEAINIFFKAKV